MKYLKKTPIAILIMIVSILLSSLLGCGRSLAEKRAEVVDCFYSGVDGSYSIQSDLEMICAYANNFKTIASRYVSDTDPLITSLTEARQRLSDAVTVPEKHSAAEALYSAVTLLYSALEPEKMNSTDRSFRSDLYDDISTVMKRISENGYNALASDFNKILDSFPASKLAPILAPILGIEPVELYGRLIPIDTETTALSE